MEGDATVSARDALANALWDNYTQAQKNEFIDAHRDEVALEIGRDALRDGLVTTLTRLVGEVNTTKLLADHRGAVAHELAEKQRAWANSEPRRTSTEYGVAMLMAHLIDPSKSEP